LSSGRAGTGTDTNFSGKIENFFQNFTFGQLTRFL
jgi:hypothetical protein